MLKKVIQYLSFNDNQLLDLIEGRLIIENREYQYLGNKFSTNFVETWNGFGFGETGLGTRNSPIFWIIISIFNNFITQDFTRILNSTVSLLISIFFFECLCLKFKKIDRKTPEIKVSEVFYG